MSRSWLVALALAGAAPLAAAEPYVARGPYLQLGTADSVTVVWRTSEPTDGVVEVGASPDALTRRIASSARGTQHEVKVDGLGGQRRIYYAVGTPQARLGGGDAVHYYEPAPPRGARVPFRAWVLGDSGTGDARQAGVRDAMLRETGLDRPRLALHLGDMAYTNGTEAQFQSNFFEPYQVVLRNTVLWPTFGNHEGNSSSSKTATGPYYDAYVVPTVGEAGGVASGTEAYYSFDFGNVHFIVLNSHDVPREPDGAMLQWLVRDLAATDQDWIVATMHHPPYSFGSHNSDRERQLIEMREHALPILEAGGVDLVLAGHSHIYERSMLIDSAYATPTTADGHVLDPGDGRPLGDGVYRRPRRASHAGTVYVVAGHGGAPLDSQGKHPVMYTSQTVFGSALLDVDADRLTLVNLRADGVRTDTFTLMKSPGLVVAAPNGGESLKAGTSSVIRWADEGGRANVRIDWSPDRGATWNLVVAAAPNTGSYSWTLPATTSTGVLVRVVDPAAPEVSDRSDAPFTVFEGDAAPTRPNSPPAFGALFERSAQSGQLTSFFVPVVDPDGDEFTLTVDPLPPEASLNGRFFAWVPHDEEAGRSTLRFTADDGRGGVSSRDVKFAIADSEGNIPEAPDAGTAPSPSPRGCGCSLPGVGLAALAGFALRRRRGA
jgi:hypothetical protein